MKLYLSILLIVLAAPGWSQNEPSAKYAPIINKVAAVLQDSLSDWDIVLTDSSITLWQDSILNNYRLERPRPGEEYLYSFNIYLKIHFEEVWTELEIAETKKFNACKQAELTFVEDTCEIGRMGTKTRYVDCKRAQADLFCEMIPEPVVQTEDLSIIVDRFYAGRSLHDVGCYAYPDATFNPADREKAIRLIGDVLGE